MSEQEERENVIRIARQYLRTPYHTEGRRKGIGVDCLTLISCVFEDAGLVINPDIPHYSPMFMLHRDEEKYIEGLLGYTREIDEGKQQPGDIAIWKFGRCFSHAALIIDWPTVIHAHMTAGMVTLEDVSKAEWLLKIGKDPRPVRFFSYWGRS
jgi:cell wall-associated NlpC family hydrolase